MNYEEKLKLAKEALSSGSYDKETIEYIFPELKESEDERIRKEIIDFIQEREIVCSNGDSFLPYKKWIAWLEKQGEHINHNRLEKKGEQNEQSFWEKCDRCKYFDGYDICLHKKNFGTVTDGKKENCKNNGFFIEKQGEQKPAEKVEPKFKVGDWITNGESTWKVTDIKPLDYILQSQNGDVVDDTISYVDENLYLWTIQDAKDGDVLADEKPFIFRGFGDREHPNNPTAYCGITTSGNFILSTENEWWTADDFYPATKEQRDILFQRMKEAGYEWDAEKKELKKIEQKLFWSEEDERILNKIQDHIREFYVDKKGYPYVAEPDSPEMIENNWLNSIKDRVQPQPKQEWNEKDKENLDNIIWLCENCKKGIWKPSEEQLRVLQIAIRDYGICAEKNVLESLYDELKKL